jgi:hypothetical protein
MPVATVVLCTIRTTPHFDWFADGLSRQQFKDFEWVVIDDRESMERYKEVRILCAKYGLTLGYYGKSKPSQWIGIRPALCNARNTALTVANGKYIVFHDDNGWADPNWLGLHMKWGQFGFMTAGTWFTTVDGGPKDGKWEGNPGPYGFEGRYQQMKEIETAFPSADWLHGGNMGFPLQTAIDVNGFDEQYDGEQGVDDCDFGIRARKALYKGVFSGLCKVYYSIATHHLTQNEVPEVKPDKAVIPREKTARKPKEIVLERDNKPHFANEFLIQELLKGKRPIRANPNFNLDELRKKYRETLEITHPLGSDRDWRDNQLIEEMRD